MKTQFPSKSTRESRRVKVNNLTTFKAVLPVEIYDKVCRIGFGFSPSSFGPNSTINLPNNFRVGLPVLPSVGLQFLSVSFIVRTAFFPLVVAIIFSIFFPECFNLIWIGMPILSSLPLHFIRVGNVFLVLQSFNAVRFTHWRACQTPPVRSILSSTFRTVHSLSITDFLG